MSYAKEILCSVADSRFEFSEGNSQTGWWFVVLMMIMPMLMPTAASTAVVTMLIVEVIYKHGFAAVAYLLGGPIVNPIVAASTALAYKGNYIIAAYRVFLGLC